MKKAVICLLLSAVAAFAQQKQRVAVLPSVGDLDPQRLILLTDKVREIATQNLPMGDFNILKQDVITKMIGEEELYRSCKEGVCIGDLAKKTNANYGARCDVIRLDNSLVLKFEMYSVNEEAIFETFTDYDVKDFRGMLAVLEARLPNTFKKMMSASKSREVTGGIGSVEYGGGTYKVSLSTTPQGAALSFNGVPVGGCAKSPCSVELPEGKVRILAAMEQYETADTTVTVNSNNQYVNIRLKPNIGQLTIKPAYSGNIGANRGWSLNINGKAYSTYENALSPGNYAVKLSHECYEEINFKVGIVKGSRETFNLAQHLKPKTGVLILNAHKNGAPVSETVFVNGSPAGQTPFNGAVPVCSEVAIGNSVNKVNVNPAHNETVQYNYVFPAAPTATTPPPRGNAPYAAQQAKQRKTPPGVMTLRVASAAAGGIGVIGGLVVNGGIQAAFDEYYAAGNTPQAEKARENVNGKIALRNTLYTVAGVGLAGFTVTLFF